MRSPNWLTRVVAVLLATAFACPASAEQFSWTAGSRQRRGPPPAFALKPTEIEQSAGLEELRDALQQFAEPFTAPAGMRPAAGLEEDAESFKLPKAFEDRGDSAKLAADDPRQWLSKVAVEKPSQAHAQGLAALRDGQYTTAVGKFSRALSGWMRAEDDMDQIMRRLRGPSPRAAPLEAQKLIGAAHEQTRRAWVFAAAKTQSNAEDLAVVEEGALLAIEDAVAYLLAQQRSGGMVTTVSFFRNTQERDVRALGNLTEPQLTRYLARVTNGSQDAPPRVFLRPEGRTLYVDPAPAAGLEEARPANWDTITVRQYLWWFLTDYRLAVQNSGAQFLQVLLPGDPTPYTVPVELSEESVRHLLAMWEQTLRKSGVIPVAPVAQQLRTGSPWRREIDDDPQFRGLAQGVALQHRAGLEEGRGDIGLRPEVLFEKTIEQADVRVVTFKRGAAVVTEVRRWSGANGYDLLVTEEDVLAAFEHPPAADTTSVVQRHEAVVALLNDRASIIMDDPQSAIRQLDPQLRAIVAAGLEERLPTQWEVEQAMQQLAAVRDQIRTVSAQYQAAIHPAMPDAPLTASQGVAWPEVARLERELDAAQRQQESLRASLTRRLTDLMAREERALGRVATIEGSASRPGEVDQISQVAVVEEALHEIQAERAQIERALQDAGLEEKVEALSRVRGVVEPVLQATHNRPVVVLATRVVQDRDVMATIGALWRAGFGDRLVTVPESLSDHDLMTLTRTIADQRQGDGRVFLYYTADDRETMNRLKTSLAEYGIYGFRFNENIAPDLSRFVQLQQFLVDLGIPADRVTEPFLQDLRATGGLEENV